MSCATCSGTVEKVLLAVDGVLKVEVDLVGNRGIVAFDPEKTHTRALLEAVEGCGFGATLEAEDQAPNSRHQGEIARWRARLVVSLLFGPLVFLLAMVLPHWPTAKRGLSHHVWGSVKLTWLLQMLLSIPVQFGVGAFFYVSAYKALRHRSANMSLLIVVGTTAAWVYSASVVAVASFTSSTGLDHVYFEASVLIILFVCVGKWMEAMSKARTSDAVTSLLNLAARTAVLVETTPEGKESEREIPAELVAVGDLLRVVPGATVPADGTVVAGAGSVDESMLTGESMPVPKLPGAQLIGGTTNQEGRLTMRAAKVGTDTTLASIARLVQDSQASKAPIQALADRIASYFVPVIIVLALAILVMWLVVGYTVLPRSWLPHGMEPFQLALLYFVSVLVIACPCALGLATPTAVVVGMGVGAKHGVLIKGGAPLETLHKVDVLVFDKTGTLTQGKCTLTDLVVLSGAASEDALRRVVASAEAGSEHPLGKAAVEYCKGFGIEPQTIENFAAVPGRGLSCDLAPDWQEGGPGAATRVSIGNPAWMEEEGVAVAPPVAEQLAGLEDRGRTAVIVAVGGVAWGIAAFQDVLRPEAPAVVAQLQQRQGIACWMVTGDNPRAAAAMAQQAGIAPERVVASATPEDKVAAIRRLRQAGEGERKPHTVGMVGDGINDSPALSEADAGIAIGAGTDVAMDAASVVLMKSHLADVITAVALAKTTFRRIQINFGWAYGYNVLAIPLAAGALFPLTRVVVPPWVPSIAMALSSVSVVTSSLALKTWKPPLSASRLGSAGGE